MLVADSSAVVDPCVRPRRCRIISRSTGLILFAFGVPIIACFHGEKSLLVTHTGTAQTKDLSLLFLWDRRQTNE